MDDQRHGQRGKINKKERRAGICRVRAHAPNVYAAHPQHANEHSICRHPGHSAANDASPMDVPFRAGIPSTPLQIDESNTQCAPCKTLSARWRKCDANLPWCWRIGFCTGFLRRPVAFRVPWVGMERESHVGLYPR